MCASSLQNGPQFRFKCMPPAVEAAFAYLLTIPQTQSNQPNPTPCCPVRLQGHVASCLLYQCLYLLTIPQTPNNKPQLNLT